MLPTMTNYQEEIAHYEQLAAELLEDDESLDPNIAIAYSSGAIKGLEHAKLEVEQVVAIMQAAILNDPLMYAGTVFAKLEALKIMSRNGATLQ